MDFHNEQILNQFLLKSLHIILDSRVPTDRPSSRSGSVKKSDKWFNLVLGDRPVGMDSLSIWNRSLMEPMIVDIIIVQGSRDHGSSSGIVTETVIERWTVQYECQKSSLQSGDVSYKKTYKKAIVLLRSVYSMLRLLPAYKAFRKLNSLKQICDFDISYKVCSFSSPLSRKEEEAMKKYTFFPVNAHQGHLSISVVYRQDLSDFKLDSFVSTPPEIITDYVGSPLADPMRAFPCTPSTRGRPTSVPIKGKQHASSHQRPHSWSSGLHKNVSLQRGQGFSGSPPLFNSPYDYSPSSTEVYSYRNQHERSPGHHKRESGDFLSPPFSPSPSPSPPAYFSGGIGNPSPSRLNSETAPMSIPHSMLARSPRYLSPSSFDPNRHSLPPLSPRYTKFDSSSNESPSGIRTIRRLDSLRAGESSSGSMHASQKVYHDARDDSGRFSSLPSSSSSPHAAFSRSSSRVSFQDDMGDCDFSCPFIVDDVDPPDSLTSFASFGKNNPEVSSRASLSTKKSQDAAVGALVHMLKTAPPLCQDSYYTYHSSIIQHDGDDIGSTSEFFKPRKTSDALEELKVYKQMKDMLLSKSAAARLPGKEKSKS